MLDAATGVLCAGSWRFHGCHTIQIRSADSRIPAQLERAEQFGALANRQPDMFSHFGGSNPFRCQRPAISGEASAATKARAAAGSVLLAGIAAA